MKRKKNHEAIKNFRTNCKKNNSFYSPSALNLIIDNNLIKDKKKILSYYDQIISKFKLRFEKKNLFIFKKIIFIGDDIKENELRKFKSYNKVKFFMEKNSIRLY